MLSWRNVVNILVTPEFFIMYCAVKSRPRHSEIIYTSYKLATNIDDVSCCLKLSATWAITPTPALWNHSFFTWNWEVLVSKTHQWYCHHLRDQEGYWHECCYEQRKAKMMSESWHQLFSIPTAVIPESSPLLRWYIVALVEQQYNTDNS